MKPEDPKVVNPRYSGATLDEVAKTVFRASRQQATPVPREPAPASPQDGRDSGDRRG